MAAEWKSNKEMDRDRNTNSVDCDKRAIEQLKQKQLQQIMDKGREYDYQRIMHIAQRELQLEQDLFRQKKESEQARLNLQWTQKLAEEFSRLKNEEIREQKRRQLLRSTSVELRQLEKQLQCAHTAKLLQIQLKEKEAIRANTRCKELQQDEKVGGWFQDNNSEQENLIKAREKKELYRKELQDQLIFNCRKRQQKFEEKQKERKKVEEISLVLKKEEMEKAIQKKEKIVRLRAEEDAFLEAKKIWKLKQKEALLNEQNRIEQIIAEKESQQKGCTDTKAEKLAAKEKVMEKIARKILDEEMKRKEFEDIVDIVYEEKEKISIQTKLRNQSLEKKRLAKDLLEDMLRQKKAMAERKAHDAAIDNAFAQYITEQNQIAIKQEQEKNQTRRLRGIRYGEELKAEIMNKERLHAAEVLEKQMSKCNDEKAENTRRQKIAEERSRILQLHASQLQGFLRMERISKNFDNSPSTQVCQEVCVQPCLK